MVRFYLPFKKKSLIEIKTNNDDFLHKVRIFCLSNFSQEPLKNRLGKVVDFSISIIASNKKNSYFKNSGRKLGISKKNRFRITLQSSQGSFFDLDYRNRRLKVFLLENDFDAELHCFQFMISFDKLFMLHASWVKARGRTFLLIGKSGAGKTTLSRFMTERFEDSSVVEDDRVLILVAGKNVYACSSQMDVCELIHAIFFLERNQSKISKLYRIEKTEAFKRIIFHSDVIFKTDDDRVDFRISALKRIVLQSRRFVLVNGKDLRNNPDKLKNLFESTMNQRF